MSYCKPIAQALGSILLAAMPASLALGQTPAADNEAAAIIKSARVKQVGDDAGDDSLLSRHVGDGEVLHERSLLVLAVTSAATPLQGETSVPSLGKTLSHSCLLTAEGL